MNRFHFILVSLLLTATNLVAQDSVKTVSLQEVVVTGQFEPQAINESVFTVKSINSKRIEAQGAVNLADVLSNNLNITLTPNKGDGTTSISMLGLNGQYVKVLIDGVPFVSVDGNGNNADITQINMNNIERVEIVEGAMAVSYGANAVAGVINLITKKSSTTKSFSIQEETVGSEYGIKKGRHIQTLSFGEKINEKFSFQMDLRRNDFRGLQGNYEGKDYSKSDDRRGYDWHPKIQYAGSASLQYRLKSLSARYRFDYFYQTLDKYSRQVLQDEHPATGITNPYARDSRNTNKRFTHSLNLTGNIGKARYNIISSYSGTDVLQDIFTKRILSGLEEENYLTKSFLNSAMSRGDLAHFIHNKYIDFAVGYEYTYESIRSADIDGGSKSINNVAAFVNAEWSPIKQLTFRPGLRTVYNSLYPSPLIYSVNVKYDAPKDFDVRFSYGRSYRTPNVTELYYYFVDVNHDVQGNPNLSPEDGHTFSFDLNRQYKIGKVQTTSSLKAFYNDISDQITLSVVSEVPLKYQYINVERFKSKGFTLANEFQVGKFTANAGLSYIGRYNQLKEEAAQSENFLYSAEINTNVTYSIEKANLLVAFFYKHTGKIEQYVLDATTNEYRKGKTDAFDWLDLTLTWTATKSIQIAGGAKNILDITNVQTTASSSGAHTSAATNVGLAYGRSYFLRATYTLNKNK
jgi:outer membrane receptor for ferrienterochelin and colicins